MKTYNELINEVAAPQSPADKEFVALHRVRKYQAVNYPEHQFKGGTEKDHTKLTTPSNETGVETEVEKEKPHQLGEWREVVAIAELVEAIEGPYAHAFHDAKKVMPAHTHHNLARAFHAMNQGGDEHEELEKHDLHKHNELHPILKKHGIAQ